MSVWCGVFWGSFVTRFRSAHAALTLLGLAALALAGCGRKGPLDMPPSASAAQPVAAQDSSAPPMPQQTNPLGWNNTAQDNRPTATKGKKGSFALDPLLD